MPIYEFSCPSCGHVLERIQKMSDPSPDQCPKCQSGPMEKMMSRTGFILKGSGWYVTDFRDSKKPASAKKESSETSAETSSSSAPAAAATPTPAGSSTPETKS